MLAVCNYCSGRGSFETECYDGEMSCGLCSGTGKLEIPIKVEVSVGVNGISVPTCPPGVTVEITEDNGDGYNETSRYDHTGRLD